VSTEHCVTHSVGSQDTQRMQNWSTSTDDYKLTHDPLLITYCWC